MCHPNLGFSNITCLGVMMLCGKAREWLNPDLMNGCAHHYHLDESTFILGVSGMIFNFHINFWNVAFCAIVSGAILFAYVP